MSDKSKELEQPEAGEFTKNFRKVLDTQSKTVVVKDSYEACDIIDRLGKEARTTVGTNTRLKAEYNKLEAEIKMLGKTNIAFSVEKQELFDENEHLKAQLTTANKTINDLVQGIDKVNNHGVEKIRHLKAQVKYTVDYCKVRVSIALMSVWSAVGITGLPYSEVKDWPLVSTEECLTLRAAIAKADKIVEEQNEKT